MITSHCLFTGYRLHIGQLFDTRAFDTGHRYGYATLIAHILNIPFVVAAQAFIVEKANRCLDFTVTIFINHILVLLLVYHHFPLNFKYYLINAVLIIITVLLAECFCMRLEQQEIKLTFDGEGLNNLVKESKKVIKEVEGTVRTQIKK